MARGRQPPDTLTAPGLTPQPSSIWTAGVDQFLRKKNDGTSPSCPRRPCSFSLFLFVASAFNVQRSTLSTPSSFSLSHIQESTLSVNHPTLRIAGETPLRSRPTTEPRVGISKRTEKYPSAGEISFSRVRHTINSPALPSAFLSTTISGVLCCCPEGTGLSYASPSDVCWICIVPCCIMWR